MVSCCKVSFSDESWRRVERAALHRTSFTREFSALFDHDPYTIRIEPQSERTAIIRVVRDRPIKSDLALILGEFFYQLRAALDSLTYQAAVQKRGDPPPDENRLEFPVCRSQADFRKTAFNKISFSNELSRWVELIQPYNAGNARGTPFEGISSYLRLLHDCARKDRHRQLHIVAAIPIEATGRLHLAHPAKIASMEAVPCNLLENESAIFRFELERGSPENVTYVQSQLSIDISIKEIPGYHGQTLGKVVESVEGAVMMVIRTFEEIFKND